MGSLGVWTHRVTGSTPIFSVLRAANFGFTHKWMSSQIDTTSSAANFAAGGRTRRVSGMRGIFIGGTCPSPFG